ncbi:heme-dependent oxidative N-demethylase subunit alpha family protein [Ramlibacter sp. MMS24-I3-19]|uniref:heme-dependent oxidative N-demethylase subunit alpha family protein n=1 Tax=Ramlibacter sp. MMS24-I3-19 TaxID=3416606 RepID=UPI003D024961
MDFDLASIATPFRMQPGLRRLGNDARHLTPLAPDSPLAREKQRVVQAGQSRLAVPGFDAAPALAAITQQAAREGIAVPEGTPVELAVEEDFAILDGASGTLPWLSVCLPSHWSPEDKLGLDFVAVHRPVADSATLLAANRHLVELATSGEHWERHVWTVSPSPRFDQHPRRHAREPWPDAADPERFAAACFLRAERQTFFPVGQGTRQAVFTIRVMLQPLAQAVDTAAKAARLHDALASMSEAVLQYKGLAPAREPLLRWLQVRRG